MSLLQEIPASPFRVKVDPSHDASKVKAEGPGLNKTGETWVEVARPVLDREGLLGVSRRLAEHCWDAALETAGVRCQATGNDSVPLAFCLTGLCRCPVLLGKSFCV